MLAIKSGEISKSDYDYLFSTAAFFGVLKIVDNLLQDNKVDPRVSNDSAIFHASEKGYIDVLNRLLEDNRVNPAVSNNYAIYLASKYGQIKAVKRLLQDNRVNASANNNEAIRFALMNCHYETAYILAKHLWPNGKCDMPEYLYSSLPAIKKGARLAAGRNDALQVLRCLQQGFINLSLYTPEQSKGRNLPLDIVNKIAKFAGIDGKVKLEKDDHGIINEYNETEMEVKYRKCMAKRLASIS
jgi:hypothetical protein